MAYVFNNIDAALEEDEANIFANTNNGNVAPGGQGGSPRQQVKTTTEGDLGGGGLIASSATSGVEDYKPGSYSDADVFRLNIGKSDVGRGKIAGIGEELKKRQDELQNRADQWKDEIEDRETRDFSDTTVSNAIDAGGDEFDEFRNTLTETQAPVGTDTFDASYDQVTDANLLGSGDGLRRLISKGQGPRYSRGMGAFDSMLMQKNPDFQNLVGQVRGDRRGLENQSKELKDDLPEWARTYSEEAREKSAQEAEDAIAAYQAGLIDVNEGELGAFQDRVSSLDREKIEADALAKALASVGADLKGVYGDRINDFINAGDVQGSEFVDYLDPSNLTYKDFIDQSEADRLNRASGLLSGLGVSGDSVLPYLAGSAPEDLYSIDETGLENSLGTHIVDAREAKDVANQTEIDKILAAAQTRAQDDNLRRQGLAGSYGSDMQRLTDQFFAANPELAQYYNDQIMQGFSGGPQVRNYSFEDALTAGDAARLNALLADTGLSGSYSAGGGLGPSTYLDPQGYNSYLRETLTPIHEQALSEQQAQADAEQRAAEQAAQTAADIEAFDKNPAKISTQKIKRNPGLLGGPIYASVVSKPAVTVVDEVNKLAKRWGF